MEATIIEVVKEGDGQQRWLLVLDKTIFYPRGGGQATDQGFLFIDAWKGKVSQVLLYRFLGLFIIRKQPEKKRRHDHF